MEEERLYLILKNGYCLNDLVLQAGQIYTEADFEQLHEQRIVALVLGRILYRGTKKEVEAKYLKYFGDKETIKESEVKPEKNPNQDIKAKNEKQKAKTADQAVF